MSYNHLIYYCYYQVRPVLEELLIAKARSPVATDTIDDFGVNAKNSGSARDREGGFISDSEAEHHEVQHIIVILLILRSTFLPIVLRHIYSRIHQASHVTVLWMVCVTSRARGGARTA